MDLYTNCRGRRFLIVLATAMCTGAAVYGSNLDTIGVTLLRTVTTNLDGAGVHVAQVEAESGTNLPPPFEVNPGAVGKSAGLFTYYSDLGASSDFPNSVGSVSGHANTVAGYFYGASGGVATNVAHVDNYYANYFLQLDYVSTRPGVTSFVSILPSTNINDRVVNQSFIVTGLTIAEQETIDTNYDTYADQYHTLFVSGAGNSGPVSPPSTCYDGLSVGDYGGSSSYGPTLDNGRCKPDIVAPETATSFSTPQVAGAAAVLMQAGLRGDGGGDTNDAADMRTVKALLLNGAIKPADWTNSASSPLDARYGAGVLNVFNSYEQLANGEHPYTLATSVPVGGSHPPPAASGSIGSLSGWDFNTNSSSATQDGVNHYYFDVTNGVKDAPFTATATLVWNRHANETGINDLDLFLYDANSGELIGSSTSSVDNVEHLYIRSLPQGRYDLQVLKNGGSLGSKRVTKDETYALAFEFFSMSLNIAPSGAGAAISWPVYPAGFVLESTTNLAPPVVWTPSTAIPVVTNNWNQVMVNTLSGNQWFRLRRP